MQKIESEHRAGPNCISQNQTEITDRMRGILVDWLIGVHKKFSLTSETLFLCVDLIDRYCSLKTTVKRSQF